MKFGILRDNIGIAICDDCQFLKNKKCYLKRKSSDTYNSCKDFLRYYEVIGLSDSGLKILSVDMSKKIKG